VDLYVETIAATAVRGTAGVATKPFPSPVLIQLARSGSWSHVLHGPDQSPEIQYLAPNMSATESHLLGVCSATDARTEWRSVGAAACSDDGGGPAGRRARVAAARWAPAGGSRASRGHWTPSADATRAAGRPATAAAAVRRLRAGRRGREKGGASEGASAAVVARRPRRRRRCTAGVTCWQCAPLVSPLQPPCPRRAPGHFFA